MANLWLCGKMHGLHVSCRPYMVEQINDGTMSLGNQALPAMDCCCVFPTSTAYQRTTGITTPLILTDTSTKDIHTESLKGDTRGSIFGSAFDEPFPKANRKLHNIVSIFIRLQRCLLEAERRR